LVQLRRQCWEQLLEGDPIGNGIVSTATDVLGPQRAPQRAVRAFERARRDGGVATAQREALTVALLVADRDGLAARAALRTLEASTVCGIAHAHRVSRCREASRTLQRARDGFVAANLGLVVTVARRYERRHLGFADLIQEGNTGLIKAVDRFDPERGFRFSTYAVWWIRHAIGRALSDRGREIRLPVHVAERQQSMIRVRNRFELRHGRRPDADDLARVMQLPKAKIEALLAADYARAYTIDRQTRTSAPVEVDTLPASLELPEAALDGAAFRAALTHAMDRLSPIQRDVLTRRFGLTGEEPLTLREVGNRYGLSRERIRQIQEAALGVMRREFRRRRLLAARSLPRADARL
jgi:RNA polymerase primary sigma factor